MDSRMDGRMDRYVDKWTSMDPFKLLLTRGENICSSQVDKICPMFSFQLITSFKGPPASTLLSEVYPLEKNLIQSCIGNLGLHPKETNGRNQGKTEMSCLQSLGSRPWNRLDTTTASTTWDSPRQRHQLYQHSFFEQKNMVCSPD